MFDLDEAETYRQLDPSGMLQHLHALPEQCQVAWERALAFELPETYKRVDKAIILGMGGSAIGGDLLRSLALLESRLPVWVHRGYDPPPFLDNNTLLIVSSYSGNTEETLSSFAESLATDAKKLAITGGGKLQAMAEKEGIPVFPIDYQAPPRAAFPHSFIPLLGIFQNLDLLADKSASLAEAVQVMTQLSSELAETVPLASNPAKQLAARISGKLAVIYGAQLFSEVGRRWKGQFNENSKNWAFHEVFPELNHNAVVGYEFPPDIKDRILVVLLHSSLLHRRISDRYRLTSEILTLAGIGHEWVEAKGNSPLAQMMSLVLFGDYVSFYLALMNGVDPTPVAPIDYLKKRLAEL
ncbi:MAG: bifunctional phosphoglucose/phosphomannose isomerase [Chloroflexi bacterium]|nr:bifunctional phosphoglucose/phosphomannose isomerase [Chloroflexota bacterium]